MLMLRNADIYTPSPTGRADVLVAGGRIVRIEPGIGIPQRYCDFMEGTGLIAVPGFIDGHVHLMGGGGERGYATRTPELLLSDAIRGGVTAFVGCLGTDGVTRNPTALLAKARGLDEEGLTTFMYTGHYAVPDQTLTGSIERAAHRQGDWRGRGGALGSPVHTTHLRRVRSAGRRGPSWRHPVGQGWRGERAHGRRPSASSLSWKAPAVPMPCAAVPSAKPRTPWSKIPTASSTYFAPTAPMLPVQTTSTAVSEGKPPRRSTMPMAIGVVTDFGAIDSSVALLAPSAQAMPTADTSAVTAPASSAPQMGQSAALELVELRIQRYGQGHRGRPQQEVNELRPAEIRLVRRAGQAQQRDQDRDRNRHGIQHGVEPGATVADTVRKFLRARGVDSPSFLKEQPDAEFIDGIDPRWSGALHASFWFDSNGVLQDWYEGDLTYKQILKKTKSVLGSSTRRKEEK